MCGATSEGVAAMHLCGTAALSWEPWGAAPRGSRRLSPEQVAWVLGMKDKEEAASRSNRSVVKSLCYENDVPWILVDS